MSEFFEAIEEIIVDGTKSAKSILKALMDLDATMKRWGTLTKNTVDEYPENRPSQNVKNITPEKKAIDVKYRVIESPHPQRNKKTQKVPPK